MKSTAKVSEEAVADAFDRAGYEAWIPPDGHFNEENDIFNTFDVAAFKPGRLWLVQVKTNQVRFISDWFESAQTYESGLRDVRVAYAVVHTDEYLDGVRLAVSASEGYQWVVDERDMDCAMGEGVVEYLRGEG